MPRCPHNQTIQDCLRRFPYLSIEKGAEVEKNAFVSQIMPKAKFSREKMRQVVSLLKIILLPEYFPPEETASHATPTLDEIGCVFADFLNVLREQIMSAAFIFRWEKSRQKALCDKEGHVDDDDDGPMQNHGVDHPEKMLFLLSEEDVSAFLREGGESQSAPAVKALFDRLEEHIITPLINWLPEMAELVRLDLSAALTADVVVTETAEIAFCYPGLNALIHHRLAHKLLRLGGPILVSRILSNLAHEATGVDIHPGAVIGKSCFIDHATGVVIGGTCEIGDNCKMFQGITLGAKSFPRDKKTGKRIKHLPRHPIVEDDVTIYSNAVILGRITIGKGAIIGGNVWVTDDVEPKAVVQQKPAERTVYKELFGFDGAGI